MIWIFIPVHEAFDAANTVPLEVKNLSHAYKAGISDNTYIIIIKILDEPILIHSIILRDCLPVCIRVFRKCSLHNAGYP